MKTLHVICDNRPYWEGFIPSWGLAIGLEAGGRWTLFVTGNSPDIFFHNFIRAGGSLEQVDRIILSHLHHDHAGGLGVFRQGSTPRKLYLPEPLAPDEIRELQTWSLDPETVPPQGLRLKDGWVLPVPYGQPPEQLLVLETGETLTVLTGCAHYGIEAGLRWVWERFRKPFSLICGGFHFAFRSSLELKHAIEVLERLPIKSLAPCHCTGDEALAVFQKAFPERFLRVGAGWSTTLQP